MWITAEYEPVAAFGLRPSNSTTSGGKSLLGPTPYAVKMALLDRFIRFMGLEAGRDRFPAIRDLEVWLGAPAAVAVNRTFQKVLRPGGKLWTETIAQREVCFHVGLMTLAFVTSDALLAAELPPMLASINYFGRKGSFMQLRSCTVSEAQPRQRELINLCQETNTSSVGFGFLQRMDDMRSDATFDDVSTLSARPSHHGGRRSYYVALPYRLAHHGFNHTIYEYAGESS